MTKGFCGVKIFAWKMNKYEEQRRSYSVIERGRVCFAVCVSTGRFLRKSSFLLGTGGDEGKEQVNNCKGKIRNSVDMLRFVDSCKKIG